MSFAGHGDKMSWFIGFYLGTNVNSKNKQFIEWADEHAEKSDCVELGDKSTILDGLLYATVTLPDEFKATISKHYMDSEWYIGVDYYDLIRRNKKETKMYKSGNLDFEIIRQYEAALRESLSKSFPELLEGGFKMKLYFDE